MVFGHAGSVFAFDHQTRVSRLDLRMKTIFETVLPNRFSGSTPGYAVLRVPKNGTSYIYIPDRFQITRLGYRVKENMCRYPYVGLEKIPRLDELLRYDSFFRCGPYTVKIFIESYNILSHNTITDSPHEDLLNRKCDYTIRVRLSSFSRYRCDIIYRTSCNHRTHSRVVTTTTHRITGRGYLEGWGVRGEGAPKFLLKNTTLYNND